MRSRAIKKESFFHAWLVINGLIGIILAPNQRWVGLFYGLPYGPFGPA